MLKHSRINHLHQLVHPLEENWVKFEMTWFECAKKRSLKCDNCLWSMSTNINSEEKHSDGVITGHKKCIILIFALWCVVQRRQQREKLSERDRDRLETVVRNLIAAFLVHLVLVQTTERKERFLRNVEVVRISPNGFARSFDLKCNKIMARTLWRARQKPCWRWYHVLQLCVPKFCGNLRWNFEFRMKIKWHGIKVNGWKLPALCAEHFFALFAVLISHLNLLQIIISGIEFVYRFSIHRQRAFVSAHSIAIHLEIEAILREPALIVLRNSLEGRNGTGWKAVSCKNGNVLEKALLRRLLKKSLKYSEASVFDYLFFGF